MDDKTKAGLLGDIEYFSAKMEADHTSMLFLPLAKAYVELTRFDEAANVLMKGLDANPDIATAKTLLAQCYIGMGRVEEAKGLLTEIRVLDQNNYLAEKLLGKIYQSEGENKKAIVSYKNAYFTAPEDLELKETIEELLSESGMQFSDLRDERNLMEDEELLDTIGQELADEVRSELGASAERPDLSDMDVKDAVEDIIGQSPDFGADSLDRFTEDDSPAEAADEIEEEMLADADERVVPTESHESIAKVVQEQQNDYFSALDDMPEETAPSADIGDLAAELSADFGLEGLKSEAEVFAEDSTDESTHEAEWHAEQGEDEFLASAEDSIVVEQDVFDESGDVEEIAEEHLASIDDLFDFVPVTEDGQDMAPVVIAPAPVVEEEEAETAVSEEPEQVDEPEEIQPEEFESEALAEAMADIPSEVSADEPEKMPETAEEEVQEIEDEPEPEIQETAEENEVPAAEEAAETDDIIEPEAEMPEDEPEPEADLAEEIYDEIITDERIDEALKDVLEQQPVEEETAEMPDEAATEEITDAVEVESADEIIAHRDFMRPVIEISEAEEHTRAETFADTAEDTGEIPADIIADEKELVSEIQQEIAKDVALEDELATLFALDAMEDRETASDTDEYMSIDADENAPSEKEIGYAHLDDETYEQVNRLENLLELIKNNSK